MRAAILRFGLAWALLCAGCEVDILPELQVPGEIDDNISAVDCSALLKGDVAVSSGVKPEAISSCGIDGNVTVNGQSQAKQLDLLRNIATITGNLTINFNGDFKYLENLQRVDGNLNIQGSLTGVSGLTKLASVGGKVDLGGNKLDTAGLKSLSSVGGDCSLHNMKSLSLPALKRVDGRLVITGNFASLTGLPKLTVVGGNLHLGPTQMKSLAGMNNLEEVGGGLYVDVAQNLEGFGPLKSVTSWGKNAKNQLPDIRIRQATSIKSLVGLENVVRANFFRFEGGLANAQGTGPKGLKQATYVQFLNTGVQIVNGFEGLTKLVGTTIQGNPNLTSVTYTKLADAGSVSISGNPKLTSVALPALANQGGAFTIADNASLTSLSIPSAPSFDNFTLRNLPALKQLDAGKLGSIKNLQICDTGLPKATVDAIYTKAGKSLPQTSSCK